MRRHRGAFLAWMWVICVCWACEGQRPAAETQPSVEEERQQPRGGGKARFNPKFTGSCSISGQVMGKQRQVIIDPRGAGRSTFVTRKVELFDGSQKIREEPLSPEGGYKFSGIPAGKTYRIAPRGSIPSEPSDRSIECKVGGTPRADFQLRRVAYD